MERPEPVLAWGVSAILGIGLGSHWKLRILNKSFGFLVLKPSGVRFAGFILKLLSQLGGTWLESGLGLYYFIWVI